MHFHVHETHVCTHILTNIQAHTLVCTHPPLTHPTYTVHARARHLPGWAALPVSPVDKPSLPIGSPSVPNSQGRGPGHRVSQRLHQAFPSVQLSALPLLKCPRGLVPSSRSTVVGPGGQSRGAAVALDTIDPSPGGLQHSHLSEPGGRLRPLPPPRWGEEGRRSQQEGVPCREG